MTPKSANCLSVVELVSESKYRDIDPWSDKMYLLTLEYEWSLNQEAALHLVYVWSSMT